MNIYTVTFVAPSHFLWPVLTSKHVGDKRCIYGKGESQNGADFCRHLQDTYLIKVFRPGRVGRLDCVPAYPFSLLSV